VEGVEIAGTAPAAAGITQQARLRVGFVLAKHFTLSAFSLFVDTLRIGGDTENRPGDVPCDWHVVSRSRQPIASSCGVRISPTVGLDDPGR
jgi:transcriptional regulator GlxA family with amidase domain